MAAESSGETHNEAQLSRASSFTSLGESLLPPARKRKARDEDLSAVYAFAPCASRRANIGGGSFQSGGGAVEAHGGSARYRSREFLLEGMAHCARFFAPARCVDPEGGFFHFFAADGEVYDTATRVLVTEARFVFTFATAYEHLGGEEYLRAVEHGVKSLAAGPLAEHVWDPAARRV